MNKIKTWILLVLIATLSYLGTGVAYAYYTTGHRVISRITYVVESSFNAESILQLNHACYEWNQEAGATLVLRQASPLHNDHGGYTRALTTMDGNNYVYKQPGLTGYLGENSTWRSNTIQVDGNYMLLESDININTTHPFSNSPQPGKYDIQTVFTHELGHTMGLDESQVTNAVMYPELDYNTTKRKLHLDDMLGIRAIYK